MDQFIDGELTFEDWLAESINTGIYKKVDRGEAWPWQIRVGKRVNGFGLSWPRNLATTQRVWPPKTLPGTGSRSRTGSA